LLAIDIHDKDAPDSFVMKPEYGKALAIDGKAFTCTVEGIPVMCAGIVELWEGRAMAWAFMAKTSGRVMLALTRKVREFLDLQPYRRIEMDVVSGFVAGQRWAELLGFKFEASHEAYYPNGATCDTFVRIRPWNM
jgi:hypothetical protein